MQGHKIIPWIIACLLLIAEAVEAASPAEMVAKGNRAYLAGRYDEALKAYDEAGVDALKSPQIDFNRGAAYFKKGDLQKAKAAWENAALNSKDVLLEAKALFNLGDCEFFEAKRQTDSDLQKALDACTQSINYFQKTLDLLKQPQAPSETALKKEASENIEIVRLVMKSILDDMKKQQEQAEKQQQAANTLKDLIEQQKALADRSQQIADEKQAAKNTPGPKEKQTRLAEDQDRLRNDTKAAADKLQGSTGQEPGPSQEARQHLNQAQTRQETAVQKINADDLREAKKDQEAAIEEMKKAQEALKGPQKGTGSKEQEQKGETQIAENKAQADPAQASAQKHPPAESAGQDDAESILNEEKENQKNRMPVASGGYREVDKDW